MKQKKLILLIIAAILAVLFSSCSAMMTDSSSDVTIDLSALVDSKAADNQWVKIWLSDMQESNFYDLNSEPDKYYAFQQLEKTVDADGAETWSTTLGNIPIGYEYKIFITKGTVTGDVFTAEKFVVDTIAVASSGSEADFTASAILLAQYSDLVGKSLKGVSYINSELFTIDSTANTLYYGNAVSTAEFTDNGVAAADGFTFNHVTEGLDDLAIISSANENGEGFVAFDGAADYSFADGLPTAITDLGGSLDVNVLRSDAFYDDAENIEVILGYTEAGIMVSVRTTDGTTTQTHEWLPFDLGSLLGDVDVPFTGQFLKDVSVAFHKSNSVIDKAYLYLITLAGNFEFAIPLTASGLNIEDDGDKSDVDILLEQFSFFTLVDADNEEYAIQNIETSGTNLFIATDRGLLTTTVSDSITDSTLEVVPGTEEIRIELLSCGASYTACITPLNLVIVKDTTDTTDDIAVVPFNAGLPSNGFLNDGGITGLDWNGSTLYIAGETGLTSLDVSTLDFN